MSKLLIASNNQGKLLEIKALLADMDVELLTPVQLHINIEVDEVGKTYAENAALKGRAFAHVSGLLTLADDTGLEVDALNGLPGLRSARFAPQSDATDADRRAYLLARLQGMPRPWLARFRCTVAIVAPSGKARFMEGVCEGEITPQERGRHGFGYDPIFMITGLNRTMAELSMDEKNRLSHRSNAVRAARPILEDLLPSNPSKK
jgi:XTP/dITP diphosphohydrolase